jgi:hypothetical protein
MEKTLASSIFMPQKLNADFMGAEQARERGVREQHH